MARRFFKHGELPLVLLALLAEKTMSAYDLMAELARLFAPLYRPSPGSIYPAVEALEAEGLVRARSLGARTTYEVTPLGVEALARRRDALGEFELRTGVRVTARGSVDAALARFTAEIQRVAPYLEPSELEELLDRATASIRERLETRESATANEQGGNEG